MADGRVLIAAAVNPWNPTPSWTRYDELPNCRCTGWDMTVGRSGLFEQTDVGSANVYFNDRNRHLDTNGLIGRAIQLQIRDPVTSVWQPSFRGVIEDASHDVHPSSVVSNVQLRCVDMFAWLGRAEMIPGQHGHPPNGDEFKGSITWGEARIDDRIRALLHTTHVNANPPTATTVGGAGIPTEMAVVFSGNVNVWDTAYDAGESFLTALRDAADAEWPGVANLYCDRHGRICFHGRESRFDPDGTAYPGVEWEYLEWKGGDGAAIALDATTAQVRTFTYSRPSSLIYNSATAWPKFLPPSKPPAGPKAANKRLFPEDDTKPKAYDGDSVDDYGLRAMPPMGDLIIKEKYTAPVATGVAECLKFANFYVANYKQPHKNVDSVTFKSVRPTDARAAATWAVLTRMDISDLLTLTISAGGVTGVEYFVEGIQKKVEALDPAYDLVEVTPNLTPRSRYAVPPS